MSAQAFDLVGKQLKGVVALAHTLLRIVYQILADGILEQQYERVA